MENKNHVFFDENTINISDISILSDAIVEVDQKISVDCKFEPIVKEESVAPFNIDQCDEIVYVINEFPINFDPSFSDNNYQSLSLLSDSCLDFDHVNQLDSSPQCLLPDLFTESICSRNTSALGNTNRWEQLRKLLKTDVVLSSSPVSLESSHQSMNEIMSIDSNQSNQTVNSIRSQNNNNNIITDFCTICNDSATGKHYGVLACEGCKGFFKRTIRKQLHYNCRERNMCPITERLRNRCQSCRFNKCLDKGMKIEAVQKERIIQKREYFLESKLNDPFPSIVAEDLLQNEMLFYCVEKSSSNTYSIVEIEETKLFCSVINKQLFNLVMWAKSVPGFGNLEKCDQMALLNKCWVEILIASFSFRSSVEPEFGSIRMDNIHRLTLSVASKLGLQNLMIRILRELIMSLKNIQVDQMEMACLKTIILFDSNYVNLKNSELITRFRYRIFDILKQYESQKYPKQPFRIYKLLLKLPSLRGFTASFIAKMKILLNENFLTDNDLPSPLIQSDRIHLENNPKSDVLYPLFSEMMKQKDYPFF